MLGLYKDYEVQESQDGSGLLTIKFNYTDDIAAHLDASSTNPVDSTLGATFSERALDKEIKRRTASLLNAGRDPKADQDLQLQVQALEDISRKRLGWATPQETTKRLPPEPTDPGEGLY